MTKESRLKKILWLEHVIWVLSTWTLLGVALFHHQTLVVAIAGLVAITAYQLAFTGFKYHCLVNGVAGTEYTLRFKNVWTGAVDSSWFNAANWLCGTVPDANTDVVIPGGLSFYPVLNANTDIRSILMKGTALPVIINANVNLNINSK